MRIEMTADDGRVLVFEDAGPEKYTVSILTKSTSVYGTPNSGDKLLNGLTLKKVDVKRLAKAS